MAQRYGRNQRRRHREAIEALVADNLTLLTRQREDAAFSRRLRDKLDALRYRVKDWDREIASLLGGYSAFRFEQAKREVDNPEEVWKIEFPTGRPARAAPGPMDLDPIASMEVSFLRIMQFVVDVGREDPVSLKRLVRLELVGPGRQRHASAAYAISEDMFRARLLGEPEARYFAAEIAKSLIHHINATPGPKPRNELRPESQ